MIHDPFSTIIIIISIIIISIIIVDARKLPPGLPGSQLVRAQPARRIPAPYDDDDAAAAADDDDEREGAVEQTAVEANTHPTTPGGTGASHVGPPSQIPLPAHDPLHRLPR